MPLVRISLDEECFRALVRGEIVRTKNPYNSEVVVEFALQDIGFSKMYAAIHQDPGSPRAIHPHTHESLDGYKLVKIPTWKDRVVDFFITTAALVVGWSIGGWILRTWFK